MMMAIKVKRAAKLTAIVAAILIITGTAAAGGWYAGRNSSPKAKTDTVKTTKATGGAAAETGSNDANQTNADGQTTITLYFSDAQAQYLVPETRTIAKSDNVYKAAIEELIKGPKTQGNYATVPNTMVAVNLTVVNGTATVDFGQAMNNLVPKGTTGEAMFIDSVVDTLTAFTEIKKVKFTAGGSIPSPSGSRVDWNAEFVRNEALIKK
jgi:spore germination protein GerM